MISLLETRANQDRCDDFSARNTRTPRVALPSPVAGEGSAPARARGWGCVGWGCIAWVCIAWVCIAWVCIAWGCVAWGYVTDKACAPVWVRGWGRHALKHVLQ